MEVAHRHHPCIITIPLRHFRVHTPFDHSGPFRARSLVIASDARPPAAKDSIPEVNVEAGREFVNRSRDVSAAFSTSCVQGRRRRVLGRRRRRRRFPPVARVLVPPGYKPAGQSTRTNFGRRISKGVRGRLAHR